MKCRNDQCNRTARRESPWCNTHFLALLTAAYGTPVPATRETEEARGRFPPSTPLVRLAGRPNTPVWEHRRG